MNRWTSYPTTIPHGLMFHHFHGGRHPKVQGSISHKEFEEILEFVGPGRLLSPEDWLEKVQKGSLGNGDLCITFDDALLCQFEIALSTLERLGIKAFWFVYSGVFEGHLQRMEIYRFFRCSCFNEISEFYDIFFGKVLVTEFAQPVEEVIKSADVEGILRAFPFYSIQDIRFRLIRDRLLPAKEYERIMEEMIQERGVEIEELSKHLWMNNHHLQYLTENGHQVGLHSYSHPMLLGNYPYEYQVNEYVRNYGHIQKVCRKKPQAVAYPANSYNDDTGRILKDLDVCCGFRSNMVPPRNDHGINPNNLELAREDHVNILRMMHGKVRNHFDQ